MILSSWSPVPAARSNHSDAMNPPGRAHGLLSFDRLESTRLAFLRVDNLGSWCVLQHFLWFFLKTVPPCSGNGQKYLCAWISLSYLLKLLFMLIACIISEKFQHQNILSQMLNSISFTQILRQMYRIRITWAKKPKNDFMFFENEQMITFYLSLQRVGSIWLLWCTILLWYHEHTF